MKAGWDVPGAVLRDLFDLSLDQRKDSEASSFSEDGAGAPAQAATPRHTNAPVIKAPHGRMLAHHRNATQAAPLGPNTQASARRGDRNSYSD